MIISQTPLRISFAGGATDLSAFYSKYGGAVVSTTIDKYIYINVNKKFDDQIRVSYSITEFADKPENIRHELVREALKMMNITSGIEITSISDIPSQGTGLGSSSAYTVGVLNALFGYIGKKTSKEVLAQKACEIEIERCHKPIGKQDQYASAYGGLNFIEFNNDDTVNISPIVCLKDTIHKLQENLLMLYTGVTRSTADILLEQKKNSLENDGTISTLIKMKQLAIDMKESLSNNDLDSFGRILNENWKLKRTLSSGISNNKIDSWYYTALKNGAIGGKILGAGGGGFLMLYAEKSNHLKIIRSLPDLRPINFSFETEGSQIIYNK